MQLAYHADDRIEAISLGVGIPLGLLIVAFSIVVVATWPEGDGGNKTARRALVAALVPLPVFGVAGHLLAALVLPVVLPIGLLVYSIAAIRRVPAGGRKTEAVAAFAISGLLTAWSVSNATACLVVDGCFH